MKKQQSISLSVNIFIVLLCIFVLSSMFLFRPFDGVFPDTESYLNLRVADDFNFYDGLSYGGRIAAYSLGLPFILQLVPWFDFLLPLLCGLLVLFLFWKILLKFNFVTQLSKVAVVVLLLSPPFIYLFTTLNQYFFPLFLSFLAFYLLLLDKKWTKYCSVVLTVILPLFSLVIAISYLTLLVLYVLYKDKEKRQLFLWILGLSFFITLLHFILLMIFTGLPERFLFSLNIFGVTSKLLISEFGTHYGLSLFGLIAAIAGIVSVWKSKYDNLFYFFLILALVVLTLLRIEFIYVLNIFICIFVAKGILYFWYKPWAAKTLQHFVILILFCGLLFSCVAQIDKLVETTPNSEIIEGLNYLETLDEGVVFSHYSRGNWITYAGHANVMDENFLFAPNVNDRWVDSNAMFGYRDKASVMNIIDKYEIKYIWIDNEMKDMLWASDEEGLLFVLKYDLTTFNKVFENDYVQIWMVEN
ncbi:MAG: hypothetical protein ABIF40_02390 [archaeon]